MIDAHTYRARRDVLRQAAGGGLILLPANRHAPRNYKDNVFPFRQNSHVLYYAKTTRPCVALVIGASAEEDVLFGPAEHVDDVVWHGPHPSLEDEARAAGMGRVQDIQELGDYLQAARRSGRELHWLPPYQAETSIWMSEILEIERADVAPKASARVVEAVVRQRARKSDDEIAEIEEALGITAEMHLESMRTTRPGILEAEVAAAVQEVALKRSRAQSYNPIISVRGEVLHSDTYMNRMEAGQLLLNDSGCESVLFYASDITRVCPVSGRFSAAQRAIYDVVLDSQLAAIDKVAPGVSFKAVHLEACRVIAEGLTELGFMKGDPAAAVETGAHALFFPHGIGHQLGLDVHDMEDLGDTVGYESGQTRSEQFGLNFLRMARPLEPGFVFTIEPGIYFIPALIDRWQTDGTGAEFIDFERVNEHRDFGGIRIEDDLLCTPQGHRVLGPGIPKRAEEVEAAMAG